MQQWTFIVRTYDGDWLRFNRVPLGAGYRRFRVVYGNYRDMTGRLEVRLDKI